MKTGWPFDDMELTPRGDGLWSIAIPFSPMMARFGRRTVVLSRKGKTALFSPAPDCRSMLEARLGSGFSVDLLIAPTGYHDTFLAQAAAQFSQAECLTSPALPDGIVASRRLPDGLPPEWRGEIVPYALEGMPRVQETVFYDAANETLIVSDALFYFDARFDWWTRALARMNGCFGKPNMTRFFRANIRDREALARSWEKLLALKVRQILPSHGLAILNDAGDVLKRVAESLRQG